MYRATDSPAIIQADPNSDPSTVASPVAGGSQVSDWYKKYLGRAPESQSVADAWTGQGASAEQGIANSPEAKAYAMANEPPSSAPGETLNHTGQPPGTYSFSGGDPWTPTTSNPQYQSLIDTLLKRSQQSLDPSGDPVINARTDAYSADQTRAARDYLSRAAEGSGGITGGNLSAESRLASETAGQHTADFRGGLQTQEIAARRQDIQNALTGALGALNAQDLARLREEDQRLAQRQFEASTQQQAWLDKYQTMFGA